MAATESLSYAVRGRVVAAHVGQLLILAGALWAVPVVVALIDEEWAAATAQAAAAIAFAGIGWLMARDRPGVEIQQNEALVVVAAVFIVVPVALALPMMLAGIGFLDALFETVSGITTTGLSTFATVADKPASLIFAAAWLQWIGGIAIVILSFALLFGQSASARRLTSVVAGEQDVVAGTRAYANVVIRVYVGMTLIGIAALLVVGTPWFAAVTLTLSAVSTGGFSPFDGSLAPTGAWVRGVVTALCLAGAIAPALYYQALTGRARATAADPELRALFIAGALVTAVLVIHGALSQPSPSAPDLLVTALSAQTTAGFSVTPISDLDPFSKVVMILSMITGGSVGSSAGGIKLLRLIVFLRLVQLMVLRTRLTPHAAVSNVIGGREWGDGEITRIFVVAGLFFAALLLSWLPFLWAGYAPLNSLFEVTSAISTTGLSTGITSRGLEPGLKVLLGVDMLLGRLEVLALLVLVAPRTWIGRRRRPPPARQQAGRRP